jgi:hypothetical protein
MWRKLWAATTHIPRMTPAHICSKKELVQAARSDIMMYPTARESCISSSLSVGPVPTSYKMEKCILTRWIRRLRTSSIYENEGKV